MFLEKTLENNKPLIDYAFYAHRKNWIEPDSYLIDLDTFYMNADKMLKTAKDEGVSLYFMLKQLGRNPYLAEKLMSIGYPGVVAVDFREAELMMRHGIAIGNAGHLVQVPDGALERLISYGAEHITVYSREKIEKINDICKKLKKKQGLLLRIYSEEDTLYSGQAAGFHISELKQLITDVQKMPYVEIKGVTSFPCILYNEETLDFEAQKNLFTVKRAAEILQESGIQPKTVDMPSATCGETIPMIQKYGGNFGEPGHGFTATTPKHAVSDMAEKQCVVYLSEISHNFEGKGYCYGGGHYRRSHVKYALTGKSLESAGKIEVIPPSEESIDYHFGLSRKCQVGDTVIMSFRYQIFVTRSDVVLVEGVQSGRPKIAGIYDSLGRKKAEG